MRRLVVLCLAAVVLSVLMSGRSTFLRSEDKAAAGSARLEAIAADSGVLLRAPISTLRHGLAGTMPASVVVWVLMACGVLGMLTTARPATPRPAGSRSPRAPPASSR